MCILLVYVVQYVSPIQYVHVYWTVSAVSRQRLKPTRGMEHMWSNNRRRVSRAHADTRWVECVECVKEIIYGRRVKHVWRKNLWTCHVARMKGVVTNEACSTREVSVTIYIHIARMKWKNIDTKFSYVELKVKDRFVQQLVYDRIILKRSSWKRLHECIACTDTVHKQPFKDRN
jgi:hypothetical protein